jgi:hypothetical protein
MGRWQHPENRTREYWKWFAVALFLLIPVDLVTTVSAATKHGMAAEVNPVTVWLFYRGVDVLVAANLLVGVVSAGAFSGVLASLRRTPAPLDRYFSYVLEVWLGLLVSAGLVVLANNLSFMIHGRSLVSLVA